MKVFFKKFILLVFFSLTCLAATFSCGAQPKAKKIKAYYTFYSDLNYIEKTERSASGEWVNPNQLRAAHKTLPFGTILKLKNLKSGEVAEVIVNDRYPNKNRLGLSHAAALKLGLIKGKIFKKSNSHDTEGEGGEWIISMIILGIDKRYKSYLHKGTPDPINDESQDQRP